MHELAGEAAALAAAALWASAVVWFRPAIARHGAQAINLLKGLVATALLALTAAVTGGFPALAAAPAAALGWMAASAVSGLTLGDTALFAAVRRTETSKPGDTTQARACKGRKHQQLNPVAGYSYPVVVGQISGDMVEVDVDDDGSFDGWTALSNLTPDFRSKPDWIGATAKRKAAKCK